MCAWTNYMYNHVCNVCTKASIEACQDDLVFSSCHISVIHETSPCDNTIILNIAIPFLFDYNIENLFKLSRYWQITIQKIYRDKKKNCHCESSQKFHGNKIRTVFSAFGCEKQKRSTYMYMLCKRIYCDACRGVRVHTCGYRL